MNEILLYTSIAILAASGILALVLVLGPFVKPREEPAEEQPLEHAEP